jgi:PAS domain S-box-containing protein
MQWTDVLQDASGLESVLSTAELNRRPSRSPDYAAENRALVALAQEMATSPDGILQMLAETALALCHAHSAGISLLEEGRTRFRWRAIVGQWATHLGGGTPRNFGPCGTVLDRNAPLLFSHPERHFQYLAPITPTIDEGLLIPFHVDGEAIGTIWVIAHDESCRFDLEDLRLMTNLGKFAAAAYQTVSSLNNKAKAHQELQKTASALRDSEERFRRALEIETVGVIYFTVGGQITDANDAFLRNCGFSRQDVAAGLVRWDELTPPEWAPHSERAVAEFIATGKTTPYEKEYFRKDGSRWWALFAATRISEHEGVEFVLDITERKRAERAKEVLIAELHHRTRNILAVVQSISAQTRAASNCLEDYAVEFNERLKALSRVQGLLGRGDDIAVTISELVQMELDAMGATADGNRIVIDGPRIALPRSSVQTLSLAMHELATNALKYGALTGPEGRLAVTWQLNSNDGRDPRLVLEWRESGVVIQRTTAASERRGYGRRLIEKALPYQLDATTRFELFDDGVCCSIEMPLMRGRKSHDRQ